MLLMLYSARVRLNVGQAKTDYAAAKSLVPLPPTTACDADFDKSLVYAYKTMFYSKVTVAFKDKSSDATKSIREARQQFRQRGLSEKKDVYPSVYKKVMDMLRS